MTQPTLLPADRFYDDLAAHYHLLFKDWQAAQREQGRIFDGILKERVGKGPLRILDAACGIGTQTLGLARLGHDLRGTDLSPSSILRARREAKAANLKARFGVADLRSLSGYVAGPYDAVLAADNALPHLEVGEELEGAVQQVASLLRPGGIFVTTLRDYNQEREVASRATRPRVHDDPVLEVVVEAADTGVVPLPAKLGPLERLQAVMLSTGFSSVEWLMPQESGFYQPVAIGHVAL